MTLTFGEGEHQVAFSGPPDLAEHLLRYVGSSQATVPPAWTVVAQANRASSPSGPVELLGGDYGEPVLSETGESLPVLHNPVNRTRFVVDGAARTVLIEGEALAGLFMDTYRVIRQLQARSVIAAGGALVHASAVLDDDGVTLFVGRKGAGKTTGCWQALTHGSDRTRFIANDQALLWNTPTGPRVLGWPATAYVGLGTIAATTGLDALEGIHERAGGTAHLLSAHRLVEAALIRTLTPAQIVGDVATYKVWLTPGEVTTMTGTALAAGGPLRRVVLPQFEPDTEPAASRIDVESALDVLTTQTLTQTSPPPSWLPLDDSLGTPAGTNTRAFYTSTLADVDIWNVCGPSLTTDWTTDATIG